MYTSSTKLLLISLFTFVNNSWALDNPWSQVTTPAPGEMQIVGSYSSGCIQGTVSLLPDEGAFSLMRQSRRRYFAAPPLRQFILWLAEEVQNNGGKLLVGDIGQARGGPTTTGHASHQIGLDVDFWFWLESASKGELTSYDKEHISAPSMLNAAQTKINNVRWSARQLQVLEMAAKHPEVERIFVNPRIKQAACEQTGWASWLRKVRPWWGHHFHFHVRLGCPENQPKCKEQEPIPTTSGCGEELDEWFKPKTAAEERKKDATERRLTPKQRLAAKLNKLPQECAAILQAD